MKYTDFYKLAFKNFKRSPGFSKKLAGKIVKTTGFLFLSLYMISLVFLAYYGLKEMYPETDVFQKGNEYLFVYFFIVLYVLMYVNYDSMRVKVFMLLPVSKKKIINFHLLQVFFQPVNLLVSFMLLLYLFLIWNDGYDKTGLLAWAVAIWASVYIINYLLFFSSRNQWMNAVTGILMLAMVFMMKQTAEIFRPVGQFYYRIYTEKHLALIPVLLLILLYLLLFNYLLKRFYTDDAIKAKTSRHTARIRLKWADKFGLTGSFIRNDIRLIWRNARPRQALPGLLIFFLMAAFMYSDYGHQTRQPDFYKIMFSMFLTGYFVMQYGSFIPAWDSEYYPLLMTQGINFRQYIEAKWWLLAVSVVVLSLLAVPFVYFGWKVLLLIWVMALFNIGVNIPLVLLSGVFNTRPIALNQKVKAFQSNENFKLKTFIVSLLRLIIPILIYLLIKKYAGDDYALASFAVMGLTGLIFKNKILDYIARQYIRRKYITLSAFRKNEE